MLILQQRKDKRITLRYRLTSDQGTPLVYAFLLALLLHLLAITFFHVVLGMPLYTFAPPIKTQVLSSPPVESSLPNDYPIPQWLIPQKPTHPSLLPFTTQLPRHIASLPYTSTPFTLSQPPPSPITGWNITVKSVPTLQITLPSLTHSPLANTHKLVHHEPMHVFFHFESFHGTLIWIEKKIGTGHDEIDHFLEKALLEAKAPEGLSQGFIEMDIWPTYE